MEVRREREGPHQSARSPVAGHSPTGDREPGEETGAVSDTVKVPSLSQFERREALLSAARDLSRGIARGEADRDLIDQVLSRLKEGGNYWSVAFTTGIEPEEDAAPAACLYSFPVEVNDHRHGTLIVVTHQAHGMEPGEAELLGECADDIALAFHMQHLEQVRQETFLRLVESEERFRQVFHQTNDAILLYDVSEDGFPPRCLEANDQACRWFGYSLDELRKRSPGDLPLSCGVPGPAPWDRPEQGPYRFDAHIRRNDDEPMTVAISLHRFKLLGQMVMLLIARDVSEERRLENEQATSLEQIQQNMEQFQILNDQIRNPVQVIIGLADLEGGEFSNQIILQAREIDQIVRQLDVGWLESAKVSSYLRRYAT
ncbi:PAS domain protein [anaerobic digester metagenome]